MNYTQKYSYNKVNVYTVQKQKKLAPIGSYNLSMFHTNYSFLVLEKRVVYKRLNFVYIVFQNYKQFYFLQLNCLRQFHIPIKLQKIGYVALSLIRKNSYNGSTDKTNILPFEHCRQLNKKKSIQSIDANYHEHAIEILNY